MCTIVADADDFAHEVARQALARGLRVESDLRNEKITYKVREHSLAKVPALLVVTGGIVTATRLVHRRPDAWLFHWLVGGFAVVAGAFYGLVPWGLLGFVCGGLTLLVARFGSRSWRRAATP